MHRPDLALFRKILTALDLLVSAVAFLGVFWLRQWVAGASTIPGKLPPWVVGLDIREVEDPSQYYSVLAGLLVVWWFAFYSTNTADFRSSYREAAFRYARALALGLTIFLSAFFLLKLTFIARSFVVAFGTVNFVLLVTNRVVVMEVIARIRSKRVDGHRVIVIGCGAQAVDYARSMRSQAPWNVRLQGHVSVPGEPIHPSINDDLWLGPIEKLEEIFNKNTVDEVLFAYPKLGEEQLANALQCCDTRGVAVLLPLPPTLPQRARVAIAHVDGIDLPLLALRRTPSSELGLAAKRLLDILAGGFVLLCASPVMVIAAIAIRLESKGPVLFKQVRAGRNGRRFTMYKFRSMVVDAEAKKAQLAHLNEMSGPVFKITRDPRVTRVGAFIRKTSIDELPQLFNIILGDMSLVGPRPPLPSEVEQYKPWQRRRLSVKPGLTGLWQVSGRNNIDFEEWMALDLRYIDDWSIWLDVKILLRTVPAVIFKTGAS